LTVRWRTRSGGRSWAGGVAAGAKLSRADVLARWKNNSAGHHVGLFHVMKGVALAAGGLVLFGLVTQVPAPSPARVGMLAVAFLAVTISYNGAAIGTSVVAFHPSLFDVVLPMAMTLTELVLVSYPGAGAGLGDIPDGWLVALAGWQLLAAVIVLSVATRLRHADYDADAWDPVEIYRGRLYVDCAMASIGAVVASCFLVARSELPESPVIDYAFLAFMTAWFLSALVHHGRTRRELVGGFRGR
jgi:hypothetical protein